MSVWENQRNFTTVLNFLLFHVVVITWCLVSCHVIFRDLSLSLTVFAPCFYHPEDIQCSPVLCRLHCCLMVSYALSGLIYMHARVIHLMENYNKKKINLCVLSMPFLGFFFFTVTRERGSTRRKDDALLRHRGGSRIFFRRGCTCLLLYFNTNKPHSFFWAEYQLY